MSSDGDYIQCLLVKKSRVGVVSYNQMAWIPSEFAVRGKFLRIGDNDGWHVKQVFQRMPALYVLAHKDDHRHAFPSLEGT